MKTLSAVAAALFACTAIAGDPKVEKIDAKAAAALVDKGAATLVDVREQEEVNSGMAKPAKWFPLSKLKSDPAAFKEFLGKLPKGKVIFYCEVGGRAGQAAEAAAKQGYQAANMGGLSDWTGAGLPTKEKP